jgi:diketogulonate reductase-like aldo/keto reductase
MRIANGYRLIDTASAYGNERQVGEGLTVLLAAGSDASAVCRPPFNSA